MDGDAVKSQSDSDRRSKAPIRNPTDFKEEGTTNRELIIADFDDVMSELLSNEESFNHINQQLNKFDTVMSEMSKRIVNLENENGKFHRTNIEISTEHVKLQKAVNSGSSALTSFDQRFFKMEDRLTEMEKLLDSMISENNERIRRVESLLSTFSTNSPCSSEPSENVNREISERGSEVQEKSPHPTTFTHQLVPVFEGQHSGGSSGVVVLHEGLWYVQLEIVILEHVSGIGTINYLNNQVPLGFAPTEVVSIQTNKNGVSMEASKVVLGYVNYEPNANDEYPHTVVIRMTLK